MGNEADGNATRGSRNEATRQHNLALTLGAIHHGLAHTRADLTEWTGLNRSTTGALVAELVELGLVVETEPEHTRRVGRPSPVVAPHPDVVALAFNPDRAGLTCAVVGMGGVVRLRQTMSSVGPMTPERFTALASQFARRMAEELPGEPRVVGAGVAVPGLVDRRENVVVKAPALGWSDCDLGDHLAAALGMDVTVMNDASAGMLAEARFGAARGSQHAIYLNGSASGIGGGAMVGGDLFEGAHGLGVELGHLPLDANGDDCQCGRRGCLETVVSVARAAEAVGTETLGISDLDHVFATDRGQPLTAELDKQADALSLAIATIVSVFGTERVVLGGHVGALWEARTSRIKERVADLAYGPLGAGVTITRNRLRERMMSVGAAEVAFAPLLDDPAGVTPVPLAEAVNSARAASA